VVVLPRLRQRTGGLPRSHTWDRYAESTSALTSQPILRHPAAYGFHPLRVGGHAMTILLDGRYGLEGLTGLSPRHKAQQVSVPIATVPAPMTQGLSRMAWAAAGATAAGLAGAPHPSSRVPCSP
jgi:hypothetical protein